MVWRLLILTSLLMFGGAAGTSTSAGHQGFVPRPAQCAGSVALTFDDGPHVGLTPILLDILKERGVRATFFVVGNRIPGNETLIQRTVLEGHSVQNHSWNHPMLTYLSDAQIVEQLQWTTDTILSTGMPQPTFVRPPYGAYDARVLNLFASQGLTPVTWTVGLDPRDWEQPSIMDLVARVSYGLQHGGVILLHDIHANTINAVPYLIDEIHRRGFCIDPFNGEDFWILNI